MRSMPSVVGPGDDRLTEGQRDAAPAPRLGDGDEELGTGRRGGVDAGEADDLAVVDGGQAQAGRVGLEATDERR